MAWRVTPVEVEAIIDEYQDGVDLSPCIIAANSLTNKVSSHDSQSELDDTDLKEIERRLAAHVYHCMDQQEKSSTTGKSTTAVSSMFGKGLMGTTHGQLAVVLDVTGYLKSLSEGRTRAKVSWLGTRPSSRTDFLDRH